MPSEKCAKEAGEGRTNLLDTARYPARAHSPCTPLLQPTRPSRSTQTQRVVLVLVLSVAIRLDSAATLLPCFSTRVEREYEGSTGSGSDSTSSYEGETEGSTRKSGSGVNVGASASSLVVSTSLLASTFAILVGATVLALVPTGRQARPRVDPSETSHLPLVLVFASQ